MPAPTITIGKASPTTVLSPNVPTWPHVPIDVEDKIDKIGKVNDVTHFVGASQAFRRYKWLADAPALNAAGDLRGMVISRQWKIVFDTTVKADKFLGPAATFASFLVNLQTFRRNIDLITSSSAPWDQKGARISTEVSSIMFRTAFGGIPAGAHGLAVLIEKAARYADAASGHRYGYLTSASGKVHRMDQAITTTFDKITDGNTMYAFIQTHLVL
jgi:hypothetical protein